MKVPSFFSGRLLGADDLKGEQTAGRGGKAPAPSAAASVASDSFERSSTSPLASLLSRGGGGAQLPDLPAAELRSENIQAKQALYAAAKLEETKLANVADRLVGLFEGGMVPIGRGSSGREGLPTAALTQLTEAVGRAAAQVRADPAAFVEADGSVKPQVAALVRHELQATETALPENAGLSYAVLGSLADQDVEALAILVLMQAAKSAKEDLKAIMDGVKAINATKSQHREQVGELKAELASTGGKYIGETEKNLSQVLARADAAGPILELDEADALFGRRTEVKDSHDRFADLARAEADASRPSRDDD
jgi:hypothetical protein